MVGFYAAAGSELDVSAAAAAWLALGGEAVFPRVLSGGHGSDALAFHRVAALGDLAPGYRSIGEPPPLSPAVGLAEIDALVVPGVGFDRHGGRLGQGGGFYDRILGAARGRSYGVCFAAQIVPTVPMAPHDARMDAVVTELGVAEGGSWRSPTER